MNYIYSEKRPWGEFHVLDEQPGFKVKRIRVNPGARLSLQSHKHSRIIRIDNGYFIFTNIVTQFLFKRSTPFTER